MFIGEIYEHGKIKKGKHEHTILTMNVFRNIVLFDFVFINVPNEQ